jgi:hypothetical protein
MSVDPNSFDPNQLEFLTNKLEEFVTEYGPEIFARFLLDRLKDRLGYEDECKLINHLQRGNIEKATQLIEKHEDPQKVAKELENVCRELDDCNLDQTELSRYET